MTYDEMIAVIQAHKEGKMIQFESTISDESGNPVWKDCPHPSFDFASGSYRVKPEPVYVCNIRDAEGKLVSSWKIIDDGIIGLGSFYICNREVVLSNYDGTRGFVSKEIHITIDEES